jgi:hypothetical protein
MELIDPSLDREFDVRQMNLMLLTASLCIQQSSIRRPSMRQACCIRSSPYNCLYMDIIHYRCMVQRHVDSSNLIYIWFDCSTCCCQYNGNGIRISNNIGLMMCFGLVYRLCSFWMETLVALRPWRKLDCHFFEESFGKSSLMILISKWNRNHMIIKHKILHLGMHKEACYVQK